MFVNVGRFRFRPMGQAEHQSMMQRIEQDIPPIARASPGFRGVYFARPSDDEVMAVWLWDSAADWEVALTRLEPWLRAGERDCPLPGCDVARLVGGRRWYDGRAVP